MRPWKQAKPNPKKEKIKPLSAMSLHSLTSKVKAGVLYLCKKKKGEKMKKEIIYKGNIYKRKERKNKLEWGRCVVCKEFEARKVFYRTDNLLYMCPECVGKISSGIFV